jgi:hypothetical protein
MWRRLRSVVAGLSLILCVASAVLWVRSHYVSDIIRCEDSRRVNGYRLQTTRTVVSRYGGIRWVTIELAERASDPESEGQSGAGSRSWHFEHEPTANYDADATVAQAEERYPFPFLHHDFSIWNRLGFALNYRWSSKPGFRMMGFTIPIWFVFSAFAVLPLVVLGCRLRAVVRVRRGRAPTKCGHDVRASPERCPERGVADGRADDQTPSGRDAAAGVVPHSGHRSGLARRS